MGTDLPPDNKCVTLTFLLFTTDQVPWYSKAEYDRFGEGSKGTRFKSKHDDKDKHR